ncbi:MAG: CAP domain-containing protein [Acidobacteria bacterium]|nr:CAP domain-containing protein [Acidobacteriota bacterium]MBU1473987.1 CAP domain-containing protein [Acidobacteriota bacterium]MBU4494973.1 CAP domain-containing protein [Acidobacteriota bacterium]
MVHVFSPALFFLILFNQTGCGLLNRHDPHSLEQEILHLVNGHRKSLDLADLLWNDLIAELCRQHSKRMASGTISFSHDGFDNRVAVISQTFASAEIKENIGYVVDVWGITSPTGRVFDAWLGNVSHREAIEGNFDLMGIGAAGSGSTYYFTQIFLRKQR